MAQDPVSKMYSDQVALIEHDVVGLAEAMPDHAYDFVPSNGLFDGTRTFGEQLKHLATLIFITSARVLEERSPFGPGTHNNGPEHIRTKGEIVAYLRESLAYARRAMASLTEANHTDPVLSAFGMEPRSAIASGVVYHSYNHYGQMVVYARMNGVVPPGSVPTGDEAG